MKHHFRPILWLAGSLIGGGILTAQAQAQTATQSVTLSAGWNAVWLEVEPVNASGPYAGQPKAPQDVFNNPAVLIVATPKPLAGTAEFFALCRPGLP